MSIWNKIPQIHWTQISSETRNFQCNNFQWKGFSVDTKSFFFSRNMERSSMKQAQNLGSMCLKPFMKWQGKKCTSSLWRMIEASNVMPVSTRTSTTLPFCVGVVEFRRSRLKGPSIHTVLPEIWADQLTPGHVTVRPLRWLSVLVFFVILSHAPADSFLLKPGGTVWRVI